MMGVDGWLSLRLKRYFWRFQAEIANVFVTEALGLSDCEQVRVRFKIAALNQPEWIANSSGKIKGFQR